MAGLRKRYPVLPWLEWDVTPPECQSGMEAWRWLETAKGKLGPAFRPGRPWLEYRLATELMIRELYLGGLASARLFEIIDLAAAHERAWCEQNRNQCAGIVPFETVRPPQVIDPKPEDPEDLPE